MGDVIDGTVLQGVPSPMHQDSQPNVAATSQAAAQRFVNGWAIAGPELERRRREQLRLIPEDQGARLLGAGRLDHHSHGLARWQAWMMRWRVQQLLAANDSDA